MLVDAVGYGSDFSHNPSGRGFEPRPRRRRAGPRWSRRCARTSTA